MQYYFAPMEGFTDSVYRNAHRKYFGAVPGQAPDRYYAPFLSPKIDLSVDPRQLKDVLPAHNPDMPLVPQILCKDAEAFLWMARQLEQMGYPTVNLNLGCPSGTVTAKGKGAGFLKDTYKLEKFLDEVFAKKRMLKINSKKSTTGDSITSEWFIKKLLMDVCAESGRVKPIC